MKVFGVFLTLCTIMALSHAYPHNFTSALNTSYTTTQHAKGICEDRRQYCTSRIGEFCPQCDANGNFQPRQCWASTGYCWCVDINSGAEIPNTSTPAGVMPVDCGKYVGLPYHHYCPQGWSVFGNMCYMFVETPKKWIEAEVYCQFDDANLVSIHNEHENRFIMSLTREYTHDFPETWTGGFDAIHPGYWMWSDGSDFTYNNWYEQPFYINDDGDDEHDNDSKDENEDHHDDSDHDNKDRQAKTKNCLRINYEYDLKWFHASCTDSLPFVCAKKLY